MIELLIRLLHGDASLPQKLTATHTYWLAFFSDKEEWTLDRWIEELNSAQGFTVQYQYELIFDEHDRPLAKSTLPYTALGTLYDETDGFSQASAFAVRVAKAFMRNHSFSGEVKTETMEAVKFFGLHNYDDELAQLVC